MTIIIIIIIIIITIMMMMKMMMMMEKNFTDNNANYLSYLQFMIRLKKRKKLFIQNTINNSCRVEKHLI